MDLLWGYGPGPTMGPMDPMDPVDPIMGLRARTGHCGEPHGGTEGNTFELQEISSSTLG